MAKSQSKQLVVCVDNEGYAASLEKRKIYVALRDPAAEKHGLLRVVDESGEDYLYPSDLFVVLRLPAAVARLNHSVRSSGSGAPCRTVATTPPLPTSAITISDVATMPCIDTSVSLRSMGTMMKPPPTPSSPVISPVNAPVAASAAPVVHDQMERRFERHSRP